MWTTCSEVIEIESRNLVLTRRKQGFVRQKSIPGPSSFLPKRTQISRIVIAFVDHSDKGCLVLPQDLLRRIPSTFPDAREPSVGIIAVCCNDGEDGIPIDGAHGVNLRLKVAETILDYLIESTTEL